MRMRNCCGRVQAIGKEDGWGDAVVADCNQQLHEDRF